MSKKNKLLCSTCTLRMKQYTVGKAKYTYRFKQKKSNNIILRLPINNLVYHFLELFTLTLDLGPVTVLFLF